MQHGKAIIITEDEIESFFKDIPTKKQKNNREYTELEKKIIIEAYEKDYVLHLVAEKLRTSPRKMKSWHEAYKAGKA